MSYLIDQIREAEIGGNTSIITPFGVKPLVYADYTASARALDFIEDFIRAKVLPYYANTHTETSFTGAQTTALREQARKAVAEAVNAGEDDCVIFCGSGATSAIHKLIDILNLRLPADLSRRYALLEQIPESERPVVFLGPYEHHSNELPWRESIAKIVNIPLTNEGLLDLNVLEQKLGEYRDCPLKIGSFSAASNVTGLITDVKVVTQLLHRHGALSFWDYAAGGPYLPIDMQGSEAEGEKDSKDAVFISPHKFIGGPGTPGILVVKKHLLNNSVPSIPGGGTVYYVTPQDHRYIDNLERREEGGTPAIIESIRAGLVFKLKQSVGVEAIRQREETFIECALQRWSQCSNIEILGNRHVPRLAIVALRIKHQEKDLHYSFVVALLNDLFGIQVRGGCSCAGPYGHYLLSMNGSYSKSLEKAIADGHALLRPGWVRLNFNYFIDEETCEYLIRALELIAEHGWRLLPYYRFNCSSGAWYYQEYHAKLAELADFDFSNPCVTVDSGNEVRSASLSEYLELAEATLKGEHLGATRYELNLPEALESLRWFTLPQEIQV